MKGERDEWKFLEGYARTKDQNREMSKVPETL